MPPVIAAIAFKVALAFGIKFVTAYVIIAGVLKAVAIFVVSTLATKAFTPSFKSRAQRQTIMIKETAVPHRILYGERRISGAVTFIATSEDNRLLHLVITLCAHEVESIDTIIFDNQPIYLGFIDTAGDFEDFVTKGKYGVPDERNQVPISYPVRIQKSLGDEAEGVQPFPDLVSDTNGKWSNAHAQTGHAKIYIRLDSHRKYAYLWKAGVPNISAIVKGKKVLDNRTSETHWSPNPAVCIEDYVRTSVVNSGIGGSASDIDTTSLDTAANVCDEFVDTVQVQHHIDNEHPIWGGVKLGTNILRFSWDPVADTFLRFQTGDKVRVFIISGLLPTGLSEGVDYYVIVLRGMRADSTEQDREGEAGEDHNVLPLPQPWPNQIQLATSYINALKGTMINLTGSPSGFTTIRKIAEPRYTCNYLLEVDREPQDILKEMASSMNPLGGGLSRIGGKWFFKAASWVTPTITLAEDDVIGPIDMQTNVSRDARVNTITGLYITPQHFDQPTTYPEITNSMYVSEDGEKLPLQIDFPATSRPSAVQRMAKIILEDARQAITVRAAFSLTSIQLVASDNFTFNNTRFGWSGKFFRVADLRLSTREVSIDGGDAAPVDVVELDFKETAEGIFDWNSGEETTIDLSSNTDLPNPFEINPPISIQITEEIVVPTGITAISKTTVSWGESTSGFVDRYEIEYKLNADSTWIFHDITTTLTTDIFDLAAGLYDFRVRAKTALGTVSEWLEHTQELFTFRDKPGDPTNLSVIVSEGQAYLSWTQSVDVDVRWGGQVEVRHDSDTSTPDWANSVGIGSGNVHGNTTEAIVPLRDGHLLIKFVDIAGNKSANAASVKVLQHSVHNWATLDTASEEPGFTGSKTQVVVSGSTLRLDVDGNGDVFTTGTYVFAANSIDVSSVLNLRVTPTVTVVTSLVNDLIDSRSGNVDDWLNWDGVEGSECDVRMEMRTTPDDPGGSPTWSAWERLDANVVTARGLEYRTQYTSTDDEANIAASVLSVKVEERLVL